MASQHLVSTKSAGPAPAEELTQHDRINRLEGGALVINHEHRTVPQERRLKPFSRPELLVAADRAGHLDARPVRDLAGGRRHRDRWRLRPRWTRSGRRVLVVAGVGAQDPQAGSVVDGGVPRW
jgi:hypothetical protein